MAKAGSGLKKMTSVQKKRSRAAQLSLHKTGKSIFGTTKKAVKALKKLMK